MEDILIALLESFGVPVMRQGSMADDETYPPLFITFWNNGEYEHSAYNNESKAITFDFDVNVYGDNPAAVYNMLADIRNLLKQNGFQTPDRGHDLASDYETHIGRGLNTTILQII